jgi:hypothetical protein
MVDKPSKDVPEEVVVEKEVSQDYLDINNPAHGNKTYEELQAEA